MKLKTLQITIILSAFSVFINAMPFPSGGVWRWSTNPGYIPYTQQPPQIGPNLPTLPNHHQHHQHPQVVPNPAHQNHHNQHHVHLHHHQRQQQQPMVKPPAAAANTAPDDDGDTDHEAIRREEEVQRRAHATTPPPAPVPAPTLTQQPQVPQAGTYLRIVVYPLTNAQQIMHTLQEAGYQAIQEHEEPIGQTMPILIPILDLTDRAYAAHMFEEVMALLTMHQNIAPSINWWLEYQKNGTWQTLLELYSWDYRNGQMTFHR